MLFRKSGSLKFKVLPFGISVQNFMKKYKVQLEKFKNYRFPRKIGCSGNFWKFWLQKSVKLTIEPCLMGIVSKNVFYVKKQQNIMSNSGIFGWKIIVFRQKNMFFKNRAWSHFRHWHFAIVCKISRRNIKYSSRYQEIPFLWRKSAVPAILESSGYKNQFN